MKRWSFALLSLLLILSMILVACGGEEEEPTTPPETAEETVEETAEETVEETAEQPEEVVTVRLLSGAVGQELELTQAAAQRYMDAHPNVVIEVFDTPDAVQDRLGVYLQYFETQSAEADLYQIDVIWPGDLAEHLIDLNQYGAGAVAGDHFPAIIENNTVDGQLVGIPWFTDAGLLFFRSDLLEKYGYDGPPGTWTELEEMAQVIQDGERAEGNADFWGFVWQGNAYEGLTCDALEWVYSNGGGTVISPDKVITINNPQAAEALETAAGWVGTISPAGVTGFQEEDARNMWQAGNAAFMRNWPYAYSLGNADDSVIAGLFDVAPLPFGDSGHGAATLGGWQIAVSKYSEHPEVAADVALFLTSREEQKIRAVEGSFNPTVMDLYQDADVCAASPFMCQLYDVFINAVARPSTATAPQYNEVSTYFFQAAHSVLTGDNDAQTALEELELDLEDVTGFEVGAPEEVVAPPEEECTTLGCPDYPIKVLFVPSVDVDFMIAGGELIEQALNEATGLVFEVSVPTSYAATIEEMCASPADTIGFIPAMGYALANQLCGVEPGLASVRYGWNVYWTEFVVARDSEYQTLEDLDGATWAYPDAGSTSGYLYPMAIFEDLGVTLADTVEAGGHPQAVKAVYNGEADVGTAYFSAPLLPEGTWGMDDPPDIPDEFVEECARNDEGQLWCGGYRVLDARAAISEEAPDVVAKVRILTLSGEIPNDTMSFSPDFSEELRQTIMDAVAAYVLSEECEQTLCNEQFYDWTDTAPIYDENFDGIRLLMEAQGITLENLGG